jgi:hypothetical protein
MAGGGRSADITYREEVSTLIGVPTRSGAGVGSPTIVST